VLDYFTSKNRIDFLRAARIMEITSDIETWSS